MKRKISMIVVFMMKFSLPFVIITALLTSCSNDLEINGPWKETMVVMGLLDRQDTVHNIRLSKAFMGEGDALKFASIADSVYINPGLIEAVIEEIRDGAISRAFPLQAVTDIPKDPGVFSFPYQVIYSFKTPAGEPLDFLADYRLKIRNLKSGTQLVSNTKVIGNVNFDMPIGTLNFYPQHKLNIKWKSVEGGAMYEVFVRFLYREYHKNNPADTSRKYVELNLGRLNLDYKGGMQPLNMAMTNLDIYRTLNLSLPKPDPMNPVSRIADSLLIRINVADENLMTYIMVNKPSNTIAQERPQFSNIQNGVGLFASRGSFTKKFRIGDFTVDSLRSNTYTKDLNFEPRH